MKSLSTLLLATLFALAASSQKIWDGPAIGGSWATAANWNNNTIPATNDIVIFPTGMLGIITNVNAGANITLGGLIIQGNSTITLSNSSNRTITIANGSGASDFNVAAGATLVMGTNVNITLASGTNANQTIATIAGTVIVSASRTFDTNNGNVLTTVSGTIQNEGTVSGHAERLLFSNGSTYVHSRSGGNIPEGTWSASSTCRITGLTTGDAGNDNQAFGNLIYNCPLMSGTTRNLGANGLTIAGNLEIANTGLAVLRLGLNDLTVGGNLLVTGGSLRIGDNTNRILTVNGNVNIQGGILEMSSGNNAADRGTLNVAGGFAHSGGLITETANGRGVINFNGNTAQTFSKGLLGIISNNIDFTINPGATVDFGTSVLNGSTGTFTLSSTAKIITSHLGGLYSASNNGAIQVSGTRTYSSAADYEFRGIATGIFTTSTNPQVRNFTVNNTLTGIVVLSQPMTVNGVLTLTSGLLTTTGANLLTIGATGSATPASNSSFVNGPMAKVFAAPLTGFTFPVGKALTGFRNIGMTAPSATSTFKAEFFRGLPAVGILGIGLTQISACEYWDLARTAGAPGTSTRVILSWENNSICGSGQYVTQMTTLKVAHLTGGTWVNEGYLFSSGTNGSGTITSGNAVTTFSPFTLASSGPADNPLAVLFNDVKVFEHNGGAQIEWSNLTEKNIEEYTIERSSNGTSFTSINRQSPIHNQGHHAGYSAFDAAPLPGTNYYRISAKETNGRIVYSKVLRLNFDHSLKSFALYPNPVSDRKVTIRLAGINEGQYDLRMINVTGQQVYKQTMIVQGSALTQILDLPASIKPGLYNITISGAHYRENKSLIVR